MPRNGTGTYVPPPSSWSPGVNGVTATTADWNGLLPDISAAISQSVSADGQTPMSGNLPMGNNKITGLAAGTALTDAVNLGQVVRNVGQCQLVKSGANLVLQPYNGNQLAINGALYAVPSAGVSLAPGAFTPLTLYYIYAYMVGTTMTLEAVTTVPAVDVLTGVKIKTGDSTRTLVGMARPIAGPLWQDAANQRFVVSWFNQRTLTLSAAYTADRGYSATGYGEPNAEIRNEFLTWAGNAIDAAVSGSISQTSANTPIRTAVGLDTNAQDGYSETYLYGAGNLISVSCFFKGTASEGYHYTTLLASSPTGTGTITYKGSAFAAARTALQTTIQG